MPEVFYMLFGCPTANFGSLPRGQPHELDVNHCVSDNSFDPRVTGRLVTRFGPKTLRSTQWCLNQEPSDSESNVLTHYVTLPLSD